MARKTISPATLNTMSKEEALSELRKVSHRVYQRVNRIRGREDLDQSTVHNFDAFRDNFKETTNQSIHNPKDTLSRQEIMKAYTEVFHMDLAVTSSVKGAKSVREVGIRQFGDVYNRWTDEQRGAAWRLMESIHKIRPDYDSDQVLTILRENIKVDPNNISWFRDNDGVLQASGFIDTQGKEYSIYDDGNLYVGDVDLLEPGMEVDRISRLTQSAEEQRIRDEMIQKKRTKII